MTAATVTRMFNYKGHGGPQRHCVVMDTKTIMQTLDEQIIFNFAFLILHDTGTYCENNKCIE